jgi:hypothetical protein
MKTSGDTLCLVDGSRIFDSLKYRVFGGPAADLRPLQVRVSTPPNQRFVLSRRSADRTCP